MLLIYEMAEAHESMCCTVLLWYTLLLGVGYESMQVCIDILCVSLKGS